MISIAEKQESEKTEQVLGVNVFDEPLELSGADAWANLVTNLIFMVPGTVPTDPEMGCYIQQYEYSFIDSVRDEISQKIMDQVRTYLPDIPLESISIDTRDSDTNGTILIIILEFVYDNTENISVVAAEKDNSGVINFAVVS